MFVLEAMRLLNEIDDSEECGIAENISSPEGKKALSESHRDEILREIEKLNAWIAELNDERRYVGRGSNWDSQAEINEAIEETEKRIQALEDKLSEPED